MPKTKPEWWDLTRGIALLLTLVTSGAGLGYWYATTSQAVRHQTELDAVRRDYKQALDVLAGRMSRTADQVAEVADAVASAAQTAQEAAGVADKAAITAGKAASKAAAPHHVQPAPTVAPPKADNRAINQAVNAANAQIKGK